MTTDAAWTRRRFLGATVAASGLAVAGLAGCSVGRASSPDPADEVAVAKGWGGEVDVPGLPKPDVTFTDMNGDSFPFIEKTKGKLALLFFEPSILRLDVADALLQFTRRRLDAFKRIAAVLESPTALGELQIDLVRRGAAPQFELAGCALEHDPQLGQQHAPELLHEARRRHAPRLQQAEVLAVVVIDEIELAAEPFEFRV